MNENIITFNAPNMITIWIMGLAGFVVLGSVAMLVKREKATDESAA